MAMNGVGGTAFRDPKGGSRSSGGGSCDGKYPPVLCPAPPGGGSCAGIGARLKYESWQLMAKSVRSSKQKHESVEDTEFALSEYHRMFSEVGHLVRRLHQISVSIFLSKVKELDVTQIQYVTLLAIEVFPGIDQTRLTKAIALDRTTISNVVRRLLSKGLLRCERPNRRTNALYLTGAGRAVIQAVGPRAAEVGDVLLAPLTPEERPEFLRMLHKLVDGNNDLSRAPYQRVTLAHQQALPASRPKAIAAKPAGARPNKSA